MVILCIFSVGFIQCGFDKIRTMQITCNVRTNYSGNVWLTSSELLWHGRFKNDLPKYFYIFSVLNAYFCQTLIDLIFV